MASRTEFIISETDSDLLFYNTENDEVHILNETARTVYTLLREGKTQQQIADILQRTTQLPEGHRIEDDVRRCIETLRQKGLIEKNQASE